MPHWAADIVRGNADSARPLETLHLSATRQQNDCKHWEPEHVKVSQQHHFSTSSRIFKNLQEWIFKILTCSIPTSFYIYVILFLLAKPWFALRGFVIASDAAMQTSNCCTGGVIPPPFRKRSLLEFCQTSEGCSGGGLDSTRTRKSTHQYHQSDTSDTSDTIRSWASIPPSKMFLFLLSFSNMNNPFPVQ